VAAVERLLGDFRAWLTEQPLEAAAALAAGPPPEPVDLATLTAQFTALRHEVNLQTRAARTQQEQAAQGLEALRQALAAVTQEEERRTAAEAERRDELLRPLLKTLVDARDALALAQRQVAKMHDALVTLPPPTAPTLDCPPLPAPAPPFLGAAPRSFWTRWFGGGAAVSDPAPLNAWALQLQQQTAEAVCAACQQAADVHAEASADRLAAAEIPLRQSVESILTGYAMSLQRLDRALAEQGLEAIDCVGQTFDPESMEVVEVVHEAERAATEVLDIVRPGYEWRGKLFRAAQVRVARP